MMKKYEGSIFLKFSKAVLAAILFTIFIAVGTTTVKAQNCADNPINPFVNCGFETGDFTGWTVVNQALGSGDWFVYSGNTSPNGASILPPPEGSFASVTDQTDPGSHVLYQDILLPNQGLIECSVVVYYINGLFFDQLFFNPPTLDYTVFPNQQARIDIMDPLAPVFDVGAGVLLNVFATLPGDPSTLGYTTINFDLSDFAGTTVRFRAAEVDNQGTFWFSIDDVNCEIDVAQVPTLSEWGLMALAGILGLMGFYAIRRKSLQA